MARSQRSRGRWVHLSALVASLALIVSACGNGGASSAPASQAASVAPATAAPASSAPASVEPTAAAALTAEELIASAGQVDDASFCGTKPMTLGIHDGLGVNAWSAASYAAVRSEAAKCPNVTQDAKGGDYSVETAISQINSFVAQKYDAIVAIPDAGDELAALKAATAAGVKVVPWGSDPGGVVGTDYVTYVDWDTVDAGKKWAEWMVKALNGKGNVVFLGGFAGAAVGHQQLEGIKSVLSANPDIKLLTGTTDFVATDWDPAKAQAAMTALLNQYPQIDGVISNYGSDAVGIIRAFEAASRELVPMTSLEANALGCDFAALKAKNPKYELTTISSRNWLGRIAARKAIAAVQGIDNAEPDKYPLTLFEDTLAGLAPKCDDAQGDDVYLSNQLGADVMAQYGKVTD